MLREIVHFITKITISNLYYELEFDILKSIGCADKTKEYIKLQVWEIRRIWNNFQPFFNSHYFLTELLPLILCNNDGFLYPLYNLFFPIANVKEPDSIKPCIKKSFLTFQQSLIYYSFFPFSLNSVKCVFIFYFISRKLLYGYVEGRSVITSYRFVLTL